MKTIKITGLLFFAFTMMTAVSCKKQLNLQPKYGLTTEAVYGDINNYENIIAKMYGGLSVTGQNGPAGSADIITPDEGFAQYIRALFYMQEFPTDEVICGWADVGVEDLDKMKWSADNTFIKMMYNRIYFQIALCNEFVRETSEEKMTTRGFSEADKAKIRTFQAEIRYLRALSYYHAMDLFGNVPFVDEDDKPGSYMPDRIARADLFAYIESELKDVENKLLDPTVVPYGRASKAAAQFVLAKMYLNAEVYIGANKYDECVTYCDKIMNPANGFQLENNYVKNFRADNHTSSEIIFPVVNDGQFIQSWGGTTFLVCASIGGSMVKEDYGVNGGWGGLRARPELVNKFTDSIADSRYQFYTDGQTKEIVTWNEFTEGYALPKFRNINTDGSLASNNALTPYTDTDFPMFRLADVYLMYAEATLRGGNGNSGLALTLVNNLRERAYGNASHNFGALTLPIILDERSRELHWECTRRTDLVRFGLFTSGSYLWAFKGGDDVAGVGVADYLNLYPIPNADLALNTNLSQNFGYN